MNSTTENRPAPNSDGTASKSTSSDFQFLRCGLGHVWFCAVAILLCATSVNSRPLPEKLHLLSRTLIESVQSGAATSTDTEIIQALVVFETPTDGPIQSSRALPKLMSERRRETLHRLTSYTSVREEAAISAIEKLPNTKTLKRFFILRSALVSVPVSELESLTQIPGVESVIENAKLTLDEPVEEKPALVDPASGPSIALQRLNIPQVWAQGIRGNGRVVASFDTGVDGTHPALSSKFLGSQIGAGSAFFAPNSTDTIPFDKIGHGSHTMGIMVGSNATDTFGVAPAASWISAAVVDQGNSLNGTLADILAAFQWALNPDGDPNTTNDVPDVILNSWGVPVGLLGPCDNTFWSAIDNVEAAGIVTIFAAGNEGPNPYTTRSPANRIASPLNSFAVGAIDPSNLIVPDFSSRGPSTCDSVTIKPEVVAPGVLIYSCDKNGGYAIRSGTSMAAPYIAGIVALLRQYNPNATVSQIKGAIINSCTDLGPLGEDNAYGRGLPDALRALQALPAPQMPQVQFVDARTSSGLPLLPGSSAQVTLTVQAPVGAYDSLKAILQTPDNINARVSPDTVTIKFSPATGKGTNLKPFMISVNDSAVHGSIESFTLTYVHPISGHGELNFNLTIGTTPPGDFVTHFAGDFQFSVGDYGKLGLGEGSAYNTGGAGLRIGSGKNLLYESGVIVARSSLQYTDAIRDSLGYSYKNDFRPKTHISIYPEPDGASASDCSYQDNSGSSSIPITVKQRVRSYTGGPGCGYAIVEFTLYNHGVDLLTNLRLGWFNDFDLASVDQSSYDPGLQLVAQSASGISAGVASLTPFAGLVVNANAVGKSTFTRSQKYQMLTTTGANLNASSGDLYNLFTFGPFTLQPYDSQTVALVVVVAGSDAEVATLTQEARMRYLTPTDVNDDLGDDGSALPEEFSLAQNYPNPFNPSTVIEFALTRSGSAKLEIYNTLGQVVRTLVNRHVSAGAQQVTWDGRDNNGSSVASGIYFYRLKSDEGILTRKMTLVK